MIFGFPPPFQGTLTRHGSYTIIPHTVKVTEGFPDYKVFEIRDNKTNRTKIAPLELVRILAIEGFRPEATPASWYLHDRVLMVDVSDSSSARDGQSWLLGLDLRDKRRIAFNGWLSPRGSRAIVPGKDTMAKVATYWGHQADANGIEVSVDGPALFVTSVPNLLTYRFRRAGALPILFRGKTLVADSSAVFDRNGRSATISAWRANRRGEFRVDLATGKAKLIRWLP